MKMNACYGCDYQLWTHVRPQVSTEICCFRSYCGAITVVRFEGFVSESSPWDEHGRARPEKRR